MSMLCGRQCEPDHKQQNKMQVLLTIVLIKYIRKYFQLIRWEGWWQNINMTIVHKIIKK